MKKIYRVIISMSLAAVMVLSMSAAVSADTASEATASLAVSSDMTVPEEAAPETAAPEATAQEKTATVASVWSSSFKMTGCTASSVTVSWEAFKPDSGYTFIGYTLVNSDTNLTVQDNIPASATSITISGLSKGYVARYRLEAHYKSSYGSVFDDLAWTYVNTTPAIPSSSDFGLAGLYSTLHKAYIAVLKPDQYSGSQVKLYNVKTGKSRYYYAKYLYTDDFKIGLGVTYKYKVRYYYVNEDNGKSYFGGWSKWKAFNDSKVVWYSTSRNGCKIKLTGAKGISKYKVYVSTSDKKKGKLTKTIKLRSGVSKRYTINKMGRSYMKKGKTYYVKVFSVIKTGGKTYSNPIYGKFSFRNSY